MVLDKNIERLRHLGSVYGNRVVTVYSSADSIERALLSADAVIGAVLVPGAEAPKLITRAMVARMKAGSVLVDVAIDQGGCAETSRPTSHTDPTYVVDGVLHYCVTNMPAAVARTSTFALNNATIGHAMALADKGWTRALSDDPCLRAGLNICRGSVTYAAVASAHGYAHVPAEQVLT
jgi:Alanine dehydrogenase